MAGDVTRLLQEFNQGGDRVRSELIEKLYPELRRIAEARMMGERHDHTLQPTALVNEFFLQLARRSQVTFEGRAHFLAAASEAMRRLLIDYARAHRTQKRGGNSIRVQLDELATPQSGSHLDLVEIGEVLDRLAGEEPRMARVVEMHCFGGLSFREVGQALGIDERTAKRDWQVAKAWLFAQLRRAEPDVGRGMGTD